MADRRFSDKEVGEILKAAAEMQSGLAQSGTAEGMTLSELKKVAEELGIDSENVGLAAAELVASPEGNSRSKSNSILLQRTIDGEISDEIWDDLVTELRRFTGKPGQSQQKPNSREWTGATDTRSVTLTAICRKGKTRLKLLGDASGATTAAITLGLTLGVFVTLVPIIIATKSRVHVDPLLTTILTVMLAIACSVTTLVSIRANRKLFNRQIGEVFAHLGGILESDFGSLEPKNSVSSGSSINLGRLQSMANPSTIQVDKLDVQDR